jgi:HAD superfamily hydrolase (TIGR01509 family)
MKNSSQIRRPKAILFDHDGVLVASEPLHWRAWGELLKTIGLPYDEARLRALVGKTAPQILSAFLDEYRPGWSPGEYDLDALALRKNDFYGGIVSTLQAYPGVREGLAWMRKSGIRAAVVSNSKRRELLSGLDSVGLTSYFDEILSRDDVKPPKPDPTPYLTGAALLGVDVADALAVEDSPPGLEAGLVAKIPTAAVMTNFTRSVLEQPVPGRPDLRPIWIGEDMDEFFTWLKSLSV